MIGVLAVAKEREGVVGRECARILRSGGLNGLPPLDDAPRSDADERHVRGILLARLPDVPVHAPTSANAAGQPPTSSRINSGHDATGLQILHDPGVGAARDKPRIHLSCDSHQALQALLCYNPTMQREHLVRNSVAC